MTSNWTRAIGIAALSVVCAGGLGCAEERDPINRVQPNALHKSFFVGADIAADVDNPDFYANGTLTDIGYGAAHDGIFSAFYSNDMSIIRWEITEKYLNGRVAYERIDGTDGKGAGKRINDGQIIYSFPIQSHFDIRHAYNPSTGEEMNIIEENTSDRQWNEREYFRVDWSRNLITSAYDFDTLAFYQMFDAVEYEEVGYYENDPNDESAPHFEVSDNYFDVTTRALAKPGEIDLRHLGWGIDKFPACFLDADFSGGTAPTGSCNPVEVSIRHSFWKKPNNDYEPQHWDGYRFQSAGAFLKERMGYARNYGMSDEKWHRFIQRYNIWKRSHFYKDPAAMTGAIECYTPDKTPADGDPRRDVDPPNGTHDECEQAGAGSQCDTFSQKCTLPYNEREVRPIVWYFTNKSDYRFYDATIWATQEWDVAMKVAVQSARNAECYRTGGADCENSAPVPHGEMTQMTDLVDIEREVDACRTQKGTWDVKQCASVVDQELAERGYQEPDLTAMKTIALMSDAVVLCHSPVQADDHPACAPGKPRLPAGITSVNCQEAVEETGNATHLEACKAAYTVRIGDVRHHLINVIKSPETPSPWGFGPTYADPLTGEGISASINVWTAPTDLISQATVDIARFVAGELKPSDITDGKYVKDWVKAAEVADKGRAALPPMDRATYDERMQETMRSISRDLEQGISTEAPANVRWGEAPQIPPELASKMSKLKELEHVKAAVDAPTTRTPLYIARMENARGTGTEAQLINKPMLEFAGIDGTAPVEMQRLASPLRGMVNPTMQRQLRHMKEHGLAQRGACLLHMEDMAPSPTAMIGLSKHLQTKFGAFNPADAPSAQLARAEKMKQWMADKMHYSVIIHEMGHTFGYRHNFVSSSSAINYRPQYWQLRTKNGAVNTPCTDLAAGDPEAAACVGPRYFDPVTQEESDNLIHMWMHSSVMDYAGDYTQDLLGLGAWDYHAARMFYGDVAAVYEDGDLGLGTELSGAIHDTILDTFGGILGYRYQNKPAAFPEGNNIHYSQLNATYKLIDKCTPVETASFQPSYWDKEKQGEWHPTLDGLLVQVDGQYSRCFGRRVAYADWDDLKPATLDPNSPGGQIAGATGPSIAVTGQTGETCNSVDGTPCAGGGACFQGACWSGRTRVPYGFATDRWADLGNLAVYRHDNGADAYELFEFFISEQELRHIFDNYRRDRTAFSVRNAATRILTRYNEKMRDGAKGVGLIKNNLFQFGLDAGYEPNGIFAAYAGYWGFQDTLLASGLAFDHFARQVARPQAGYHEDPSGGASPSVVLRSAEFLTAEDNPAIAIPDGAQGFWNAVGIGGKLVNNSLSSDQGEYDAYYTLNAGSYYDKIWAPMLLTESVDNFISDSLDDFTDARYRSVSMADLFTDGYRRFLANNLTDDDWAKAPRVAATSSGAPMVDEDKYPSQPMGWISWWTDTPTLCFSNTGNMVCTGYDENGTPFEPNTPAFTRPVDPQVGWEMQKFLISQTMIYLPENQKQVWKDMLSIWSIGDDSDPGFTNRIELHVPNGDIFVARTYGTEQICFEQCQTVQRGIGARILEYANRLLEAAYVTTPVTQNGVTWYVPVVDNNGNVQVKYDPGMEWINPNFTFGTPPPDCNATNNSGCKCEHNAACKALEAYVSVPEFVRNAVRDFDVWTDAKGIY